MPVRRSTVCAQPAEAEAATFVDPRSAHILARMDQSPAITVAAVAEDKGRFLLVEEHINHKLVLNQPAGHVERGETLLEAVIREAREETAWRFEPNALLGAYLWRNPETGYTTLRFAFTGTVSDHKPGQPLDTGIVTTRWLTREQLMEREPRLRSPLVLRCVDDYLNGNRQPLESVAGLDLDTAAAVRGIPV
jgi:8-oxo-dGTP pyrophosphatase MutT (NUDIX family)